MWIMKQIEAIQNGDDAEEAALALGLLIEREKTRVIGDDGIKEILGDELAQRRLTPAEVDSAVEQLLAYVRDIDDPHPTAVWALTKSYDERIVPGLIQLLEHNLANPDRELICYHALHGIINAGVTSQQHKARAMAAIELASAHEYGSVAEAATQYLQVMKQRWR